ncbi:MAG: SPOR domain-containing protein [Candidatus Eisenbacteria bacterium]
MDRLLPGSTAISIDYAVLERSERVAVVEAAFSWSDLGGWESLGICRPRTPGSRHAGDLLAGMPRGISFLPRTVAWSLLGVRDLVVVQTRGRTRVPGIACRRSASSFAAARRTSDGRTGSDDVRRPDRGGIRLPILMMLLIAGCAPSVGKHGEPGRSDAPLPGSNREYPSQQSAAEARPGAAEAFPLPGGGPAGESGNSQTGVSAPRPDYSTGGEPGSTDPVTPADRTVVPRTAPVSPGEAPARARDDRVAESTPVAPAAATIFSVQLWASTSEDKAKQRRDDLRAQFDDPLWIIEVNGVQWVCAGRFETESEARTLQRSAIVRGHVDARVVQVPAP